MKALSITLALALTMMAATSHAVCMRGKTSAKVMLTNQEGVLNQTNIASSQSLADDFSASIPANTHK